MLQQPQPRDAPPILPSLVPLLSDQAIFIAVAAGPPCSPAQGLPVGRRPFAFSLHVSSTESSSLNASLKWANAWDHCTGNKEADVGLIPAAFGMLLNNYPRRDKQDQDKYKYVNQVMRGLPGTPCCVQMSHALNMSGIRIPGSSYRRNPNAYLKEKDFYYILAVDELEDFLISCCGNGEAINKYGDKTRSEGEIREYIKYRPGLLLFRYSDVRVPAPKGQFEHTELWDGTNILQRDMAEGFLFARPRVLMWYPSDDPGY